MLRAILKHFGEIMQQRKEFLKSRGNFILKNAKGAKF